MKTKRYHNIFDLTYCNEKILDKKILRDFIEEVVEAVDMSILEGPIIAEGIASNPGISILAIIDFSHISMHTFANSNEALIDIFSCKEYDREKVLSLCKKHFATPKTVVRKKEVWWG
jgi:S-adenosylmethionine decarboxylase